MNSEEKPWRLGKMERGEEIQPVFEEERRRRTAACPNLPSLLFSSSPSPLSSFDQAHGVGGTGRGEEIRVWRGDVTVAQTAHLVAKNYNLFIQTPNASCK
jgi:hypothetical protein